MKEYRIFIFFLILIEIIICEDSDYLCVGSADSVDECENLLNEEEEIENKHCCFLSGTKDDYDTTQCILLDNDEYKDIENKKLKLITEQGYSKVDVDCESYYNQINHVFIFILVYFGF